MVRYTLFWFAAFIFLNSANSAFGAVKVTKEPGKAIVVDWNDGRVATVQIDRRKWVRLPIAFEVAENTCNEVLTKACNFALAFKVDHVALNWTTHPDAAKKGKVLRYAKTPATDFSALEFKSQLTGPDKRFRPTIAPQAPDDQILCEDYRWLPGGSKTSPPAQTLISRWEGEFMFQNPETRVAENRCIGGALDLTLAGNDSGSISIAKVKHFTGFFPNIFFGDILALTLKGNEQFCQISLKPNLGAISKLLDAYLKSQEPEFVSYLFESDEYSAPDSFFFGNDFFKTPEAYTVQ